MTNRMCESIWVIAEMKMAEYKQNGGVTDEDTRRVCEYARLIGSEGDLLLGGAKENEEVKGQLYKVADMLAVLTIQFPELTKSFFQPQAWKD